MVRQTGSIMQGYKRFLEGWNREDGRKPSSSTIRDAEMFARHGSVTAFALATLMRPSGINRKQMLSIFGKPQFNKMRMLVRQGKAKDKTAKGKDGHLVYKLALPAKSKRK